MLGQLQCALANSPRPTSLCFFGDHVPILPDVYQALGAPDGDTEYFIWSNRQAAATGSQALPVDRLAATFVELSQADRAGRAQQARRA
jgi:hypothetical protein